MSNLATLAESIVFVAYDWPKTVSAKNGPVPVRTAMSNKRFVAALMECTYLGLHVAWSRPASPDVEPVTNFITPVLLRVDKVIEDASPPGAPIRVEDIERAAARLRGLVPDYEVDPELIDAITSFARSYVPAVRAPEMAEGRPG